MGQPDSSDGLEVREWYTLNKRQKRLSYLMAAAALVYIIFRDDLAAFFGLTVDVLNYVGFATLIVSIGALSHFLRDKEETLEQTAMPLPVRLAGLALLVLFVSFWFSRDILAEYSGLTVRQLTGIGAFVLVIFVAMVQRRYPLLVKKSAATGKRPPEKHDE